MVHSDGPVVEAPQHGRYPKVSAGGHAFIQHLRIRYRPALLFPMSQSLGLMASRTNQQ